MRLDGVYLTRNNRRQKDAYASCFQSLNMRWSANFVKVITRRKKAFLCTYEENKPFASCSVPLFQNESWYTHIDMSLICKTMKMQEKLIPM